MAIWLVRAGSEGEHEQKFVRENRIFVTWDGLDLNLGQLPDRQALKENLEAYYPDTKPKTRFHWAGQLWYFVHEMQVKDWIVVPLKSQPAISIGEVTGGYRFDSQGPDPYFHSRSIRWIAEAVPRVRFDQDLLYSFGAFMTICRIQRNGAEQRIRAMFPQFGSKGGKVKASVREELITEGENEEVGELGDLARDQIAKFIAARFKGHGLTRLVEALLKVQGYTTYRSPEGADGGADILAGFGALGFGAPRLCVEVKSGDQPLGRESVDKLLGAVSKFGASEGLFVSWGGYKSNVQREIAATSFFKVRLWTQKELLDQLFEHYEKLDEALRAELPLKRIWITVPQE
ncbi:MAG: restriction endonuclease [Magnetococcales bacterium]|nr:restriction endonuclease [Magnetococcales bacterium]